MKTLLILRHAKSSWKDLTLSDHDRPLKKRGKRDAPRMGELIYEQDLTPDMILSSTAKRARLTTQAVAQACRYEGEINFHRDLYHADSEMIINMLSDMADEFIRIMVVGHNPDLEELLEFLTGDYERLPTAALAQITLPIENWSELDEDTEGKLVNIWRPRELPF
jgi:phosphohistidine phosphatase